MKLITKSLLTAFAFLAFTTAPVANATEVTEVGTMREKRVEMMKENAANRQEFRQERRENMSEKIATRIEERFARHQEKLENWIARASTHLTEKESKGKNVAEAKTAIATAQTSLATAKELGASAVAAMRAITAENWEAQKADAQAAREQVKKAQVAYAQVVKDMYKVVVALRQAE